MTNDEINAMADGLIMYLKANTQTPLEGISILGIAILHLFEGANMTIEAFAEDFKQSLIKSYRSRMDLQ